MSQHVTEMRQNKSHISQDVQTLIADVQSLLRTTANASGEGIDELRTRLSEKISSVKDSLNDMQALAADNYHAAIDCADTYVHENPWRAVAIGVAFGMLCGALIRR